MENLNFSDGQVASQANVEKVPEDINIPELRCDGNCLPNSIRCAQINDNVSIIEGLVLVIAKEKTKQKSGVIKHAWNMRDSVQFDTTRDLIWGDDYQQLFYYPIKGTEIRDYPNPANIDFDPAIYTYKEDIENQIVEMNKDKYGEEE